MKKLLILVIAMALSMLGCSEHSLNLGAMNSLRNSANRMGANYVRLLSGRASLNSSKSTVIYVGNAYVCKEE